MQYHPAAIPMEIDLTQLSALIQLPQAGGLGFEMRRELFRRCVGSLFFEGEDFHGYSM